MGVIVLNLLPSQLIKVHVLFFVKNIKVHILKWRFKSQNNYISNLVILQTTGYNGLLPETMSGNSSIICEKLDQSKKTNKLLPETMNSAA